MALFDFSRDLFLEILNLEDNSKSKILQKVLNHLEHRDNTEEYKDIWNDMKENSQLLQAACKYENDDLVKYLVKNGCRLKTSHDTKDLVQENWSR